MATKAVQASLSQRFKRYEDTLRNAGAHNVQVFAREWFSETNKQARFRRYCAEKHGVNIEGTMAPKAVEHKTSPKGTNLLSALGFKVKVGGTKEADVRKRSITQRAEAAQTAAETEIAELRAQLAKLTAAVEGEVVETRPATGKQLWRLNDAGMLKIVKPGSTESIDFDTASEIVAALLNA